MPPRRMTGKPPAGEPIPIPAPSRGMNTLDNYLSLPPDQARELENWFPTTGRCTFRPGYTTSSTLTGATGAGSLLAYDGAAGTTLIAAGNDGKLWNATAATGVELATGYGVTNPWSHDQMNGYLIAVNGADTPWRFNGSTVGATGLSGPTLATLRTVKVVRTRMWFTVNDSADVWYGDPRAVAGALTQFQLSQIAHGGYCMGVYPWRDYTVFVMSTGEVIIYAGDPGADFAIYGSYMAPLPVGYDAAVKIGGDLVLMTAAGPITLELVAAGLAFDVDSLKGWGKIYPSWKADFDAYGANLGWNACYHNGVAYFNVPTGANTAKQYVCNLNVPGGAWTTYSGLPAGQFATTPDGMFFTDKASGRVCIHAGGLDDGVDIVATARQGFAYPTQGKSALQFTLARLNYSATGNATAQLQIDTEFRSYDITAPVVSLSQEGGGGAWDTDWDGDWGYPSEAQMRWRKVKGSGRAVAPVVRVRSGADSFDWFATDLIATPGGML